MKKKKELVIEFVGVDRLNVPTYKDNDGNFYKDLNYSEGELDLYTAADIDEDPEKSVHRISKYKEVIFIVKNKDNISPDDEYKYQMLGRLINDCEYYLENRNPNCLWAKNIEDQIKEMRRIYSSFEDGQKPLFITDEIISNYEKSMREKNDKY